MPQTHTDPASGASAGQAPTGRQNFCPAPTETGPGKTSHRLSAKVGLVPEGPDGRRKTSRLPPVQQLSVAKNDIFRPAFFSFIAAFSRNGPALRKEENNE